MSLVIDGKLTPEEALGRLHNAALEADRLFPDAMAKCTTEEEMRTLMDQRDMILRIYLEALKKSLKDTSSYFEGVARDLDTETKNLKNNLQAAKTADEAITLFANFLSLLAKLALAFA
jgi:hypothetical protein